MKKLFFKISVFLIVLLLSVYSFNILPYLKTEFYLNNTKETKNNTLNEDNPHSVIIPIVMYHNILNSYKGSYVVSAYQFEDDLKAFIKEGYTTVSASEVIAFVKGQGTLPEKPIMITFDDGHYNNMYYALPILKKYNAKAIVDVIGKFTDNSTLANDYANPNYSHLSWEHIKELKNSGYFEIGNHTYNLHNIKPRYGMSKLSCETEEQYTQLVTNDIEKLQNKLTEKSDVTPIIFAYPFGKYYKTSKKLLLSMGFQMIFTCCEGNNVVTIGNPDCLLSMKRYNRFSKYNSYTVINMINKNNISVIK